jgi:hypothetical protein
MGILHQHPIQYSALFFVFPKQSGYDEYRYIRALKRTGSLIGGHKEFGCYAVGKEFATIGKE